MLDTDLGCWPLVAPETHSDKATRRSGPMSVVVVTSCGCKVKELVAAIGWLVNTTNSLFF